MSENESQSVQGDINKDAVEGIRRELEGGCAEQEKENISKIRSSCFGQYSLGRRIY